MADETKILKDRLLADQLKLPIKNGDIKTINELITQNSQLVNLPNSIGLSPLAEAQCSVYKLEVMECLIMHGAEVFRNIVIGLIGEIADSPKLAAILIRNGSLAGGSRYHTVMEALTYSMEWGAKMMKIQCTSDEERFKNVQYAVLLLLNHGITIDKEVVTKISSLPNPTPEYSELFKTFVNALNLLQEAAKKDVEFKVIEELVNTLNIYSTSVEKQRVQEKQKQVVVADAGESKHKKEVESVRERFAAEMPLINVRNADWNTALHLAASNNRDDIVKLLLQHGARTDLKNANNETALQIANQHNHGKVVKIIEDYGKAKLGKNAESDSEKAGKGAGATLPPKLF